MANAATLADKLELSALGVVMIALLALLGRRTEKTARKISRRM
ncbi:unnamed protein product [[Actinomadura] parvosata subsp. kistnae]|nr:unnamed protein product [Actinomadura parvosata subsp. kistnae]